MLWLGSAKDQSAENVENYDPGRRGSPVGAVLRHLFPVVHRLLG